MNSTDVCEFPLEPRHEVEHLCLDRRVEPGRRLVEDEQGGVLREGHRDHDPLLHPARELVRVAGHHRAGVGDLDVRERLAGPLLGRAPRCAENREGLGDLRADADRRVQRGAGVLVDHRHGLARGIARSAPPRSASTSRPATEIEPPDTRPFRAR